MIRDTKLHDFLQFKFSFETITIPRIQKRKLTKAFSKMWNICGLEDELKSCFTKLGIVGKQKI